MTLYRAVSISEKRDYDQIQRFRTFTNTLEAKQFFTSAIGVLEFIVDSINMEFYPPYNYLFYFEINEECLLNIEYDKRTLDGHEAITIQEQHLPDFNNCINLVNEIEF